MVSAQAAALTAQVLVGLMIAGAVEVNMLIGQLDKQRKAGSGITDLGARVTDPLQAYLYASCLAFMAVALSICVGYAIHNQDIPRPWTYLVMLGLAPDSSR